VAATASRSSRHRDRISYRHPTISSAGNASPDARHIELEVRERWLDVQEAILQAQGRCKNTTNET
jgi:hypothetical protein